MDIYVGHVHVCCFKVFAIINKVAMYILLTISWYICARASPGDRSWSMQCSLVPVKKHAHHSLAHGHWRCPMGCALNRRGCLLWGLFQAAGGQLTGRPNAPAHGWAPDGWLVPPGTPSSRAVLGSVRELPLPGN